MQRGAILSDLEIIEEYKLGNIIIEPYNRDRIGPNSLDVTMGENFYIANPTEVRYLNSENGESIAKYWGVSKDSNANYGAIKAFEVNTKEEAKDYYVSVGTKIILLKPNELVLGHTNELIGGKYQITTSMDARSTKGRCGYSVCKCAGKGDVGYFERWTMEIQNHAEVPQVIEVGTTCAQITFTRTGPVERSYETRGQYQQQNSIDDMIKNWTPLKMIPKKAVNYVMGN